MRTPRLFDPFTGIPVARTRLPGSLEKFTCLSKLPMEVRLEIWNLTMLPRTVDIHIRQIGFLNTTCWPLAELYSPTPVPAALHVCRESRAEALHTYKLCFGTHMSSTDSKHGMFCFIRNPRTYFSYEMDVANFKCAGKLEGKLPLTYMMEEDMINIRHIRTDWCVAVNERLIRHISCFEKLETLSLTWHWREMMSEGTIGIFWPDVEVTEGNYRLLQNRPDIAQFMDAFITARDVFEPGMRIPLLRIT